MNAQVGSRTRACRPHPVEVAVQVHGLSLVKAWNQRNFDRAQLCTVPAVDRCRRHMPYFLTPLPTTSPHSCCSGGFN